MHKHEHGSSEVQCHGNREHLEDLMHGTPLGDREVHSMSIECKTTNIDQNEHSVELQKT